MPPKNTQKNFQPDTKYHVYNRGLQKFEIFRDDTDYWTFRRIMRKKTQIMKEDIILQPFCLLPNHYHFKIWQRDESQIEKLMRSTMTSYGMYYAKRHSTTGRLFESVYKAVEITSLQQEKYIDKYILSNPVEAGLMSWKHVGWSI